MSSFSRLPGDVSSVRYDPSRQRPSWDFPVPPYEMGKAVGETKEEEVTPANEAWLAWLKRQAGDVGEIALSETKDTLLAGGAHQLALKFLAAAAAKKALD